MEGPISRRTFFDRACAIGAISLTAAGLCVLSSCLRKDRTPVVPAEWVVVQEGRVIATVSRVAVLREVGAAAKILHPRLSGPIIVVRPDEKQFLAFSGTCTHRGRPLEYNHALRELRCINHGHSRFALDGAVKQGPARTPVRAYKTLFHDGTLAIFL
jgi:Rieske Fe-S protein